MIDDEPIVPRARPWSVELDHEFEQASDPNFGVELGGGCGHLDPVTMQVCGFPRPFHKAHEQK